MPSMQNLCLQSSVCQSASWHKLELPEGCQQPPGYILLIGTSWIQVCIGKSTAAPHNPLQQLFITQLTPLGSLNLPVVICKSKFLNLKSIAVVCFYCFVLGFLIYLFNFFNPNFPAPSWGWVVTAPYVDTSVHLASRIQF